MSVLATFAVAFVISALPAAAGQTQRNGLDPQFGDRGVTQLGSVETAASTSIRRDGSVVVLANGILRRLAPSGRVDRSFGSGGVVVVPGKVEGLPFEASDVTVDRTGRIVLFGAAEDPERRVNEAAGALEAPISATWAAVMRFSSSGLLDHTFGDGRGFLRTDLGLRSELAPDVPAVSVLSGAVDSRGRPVFLAGLVGRESPCQGHSLSTPLPGAVARLTAGGPLDPSFGGGDGVSPLVGAPTFIFWPLGLVNGEEPVVATGSKGCRGAQVSRFRADGSPMMAFGEAGFRFFRGLEFSTAGRSGELILQRGRPALRVFRFDENGRLDRGFGENGSVATDLPQGSERTLRPVGVDAKGRIVLLGSYADPGPGREVRLFVTRLLRSGRPDPSLGKRGKLVAALGSISSLRLGSAELDPRGRLVVQFETEREGVRGSRLAIARFRLD
jgi:uncharacterized delta-60 repeat protein